jgi:hypothetical protein
VTVHGTERPVFTGMSSVDIGGQLEVNSRPSQQ